MTDSILEMSAGNLLYVGFLLIGNILAVAIVARCINRHGLAAVAVRPIAIFAIFFALIHFFTPMLKEVSSIYRYQDEYPTDLKILSSALNIILLSTAWLLASSRQLSPIAMPGGSIKASGRGGLTKLIATVLYVVGTAAASHDAFSIIFQIDYVRFLADPHSVEDQRSAFRIFSNLMILGAALLIGSFALSARRSRRFYVYLMLISAPICLYAIILNSRNTIFIYALIATAVYYGFSLGAENQTLRHQSHRQHPRRRRVGRLSRLVVVVGVVVAGILAMSVQRYSNFDSAFLLERRGQWIIYAADGAFGNDENLLWLYQNSDAPLLYGTTFLSGFLVVIPRSVWPDKPTGAGPILINQIRPGSYAAGAVGNNSLTTGLLTESYMNFGFAGIVMAIVAWAVLSSKLMRAFHRSSNFYYKAGFLISAVLVSSSLLYQEFLGFFGRAVIVVAPLFILGSAFRSPRRAGS